MSNLRCTAKYFKLWERTPEVKSICPTPDFQCIRVEELSHDQNDTASCCSFNSSVPDASRSLLSPEASYNRQS